MRSVSWAGVARRAGLVALLAGLAGTGWAQSTGRVEGTVTDSTGASVPGANVTATNNGTNVAKSTVTDATGSYTITPLPAGNYVVNVSLSGFAEQTTKLTLSVNQVARLDFKIAVGSQTEVVEVTAVAPLVDKSTSFIGAVMDTKQVQDLPLNGRNFTQLATLSPGVTRGTAGSATAGQSGESETFRYGEFGGAALSVNGLREQFNTFQLDGIDNNETLVNSIAYIPSPEAIQEFRLITTNAPAEFGRAGGAIQNIVTKSGTNQMHGSAYYFQRPGGMAATPTFAAEKPEFKNKDFGATVGGPIVKDKTFFFLSYHALRSSIPVEAGNKVTVPTARMRNGDFSELLNPANTGLAGPVTIYDPVTGRPYPGNIIPASQINPVSQRYLNSFPLPTESGVIRNFLTERQKDSVYDDFDARVDHNISTNDTLFLRGSFWADKFSDPGRIPGFQAGFGAGTSRNKGLSIGLGETHTFSPSVVNELRLGYVNFRFEFLPVGFGTDQNAQIGIPGPGGITVDNGISLIGGGNGTFIEYLGDFGQYQIKQKTFQFSDAVTYVRSAHTFKFGVTLLRRDLSQTRTQVGKGFYFYSDFVATPGNVPSLGNTGYEVSDMLVGRTNFTATGVPGYVPRDAVSWEDSVYAQDDWRVNSRLTLNLGVRYDLFKPYYEKNDVMANFDPATQSLVLPGQNGAPRSTVDTDTNNIGPRIGFNYGLDEKTALRGSFGIFYTLDRGGIDNQLTENPPGVVTEYRFGGEGANLRLSDPIPLPSVVDPNDPVLPQGSGLVYVPRDSKTTNVKQWSASVQREVMAHTALMLAYVGTRGENLTALLSKAGFAGSVAERLTTVKNIGSSKYDALQVTVQRSAADLSYLASYTLGKATDNIPSLFAGSPSRGAAVTDPNDLDKDRGPADFDARHRFTFAGTWALPFAKNDRLLGGWSVNTVLTLQSGTPFTVYADYNGALRADVSGDPNNGPKTSDRWFDTGAFSRPVGSQGTSTRNQTRGPGTRIIDLSVFKTFKLAGRTNLELRLESFNLFNSPQYSQPNNVLVDPNFGKITGTRLNSERQFQVAGRFTF